MLVSHLGEPHTAGPETLALAMSPKWAEALPLGKARAALLAADSDYRALGLEAAILSGRPRLALAPLTKLFATHERPEPGIHDTAFVHPSTKHAPSASIGPFVSIDKNCAIFPDVIIGAHVSISHNVKIETGCIIQDGVRIGPHVTIGKNSVLHQNAAVGSEGFSFVTEEPSGVEVARASLGADMRVSEGGWKRIYALGGVVLGEEVEIGANSTVDAGTIRPTKIGDRTKIDNLVHIAHNVQIGADCLICAQSGIAGSAQLGDRVVLAGQCGVSDNITIGDDVIAGGSTKIYTNQPSGRALLGSPAVKMETQLAMNKAMRRLPRVMEKLQKLVSKTGEKG